MSWSKSVFSTNVAEVAWDDSSGLTVTFQNGRSYSYPEVPEATALEMANAPSVGQFLNTEIKGHYGFKRLS